MRDPILVKSLKSRIIFPFHINEISKEVLSKYEQSNGLNDLLEVNQKQYTDWLIRFRLLKKPEQMKRILNLWLTKFGLLTSTNGRYLFQAFNEDEQKNPIFIRHNKSFSSVQVLGDVLDDYRFTYAININKDDPMFKLIEQVQIGFYIDSEHQQITGGFSLNNGKENTDLSVKQCVEQYYILTLVKKFIKAQLYPLNLSNLLAIMQDNKKLKNASCYDLVSGVDFDNISLSELHTNWKLFIHQKYLQFYQFDAEQLHFYQNELFYGMLTLCLLMLTLLQEINNYFVNSNESDYWIRLFDHSVGLQTHTASYERRFHHLIQYLNQTLLTDASKAKVCPNQLTDNIYLTDFISTYETSQTQYVNLLDAQHYFLTPEFKTFFLMLLFPQIYSLSLQNPNLLPYPKVMQVFAEKNDLNFSDLLQQKIHQAECEVTSNYVSFISEDAVVILKNEGQMESSNLQVDYLNHNDQRRLYNNYFWAEIYLQSKIYQRDYLERQVNQIHLAKRWNQKKQTYDMIMRGISNLQYDASDNFYESAEFKTVIKKINRNANLKDSVDTITNQANTAYWLTLESMQRKLLVLAFIVAAFQLLEMVIMTTFTVLALITRDDGLIGYDVIYPVIGVVCFLAVISLGVIGWTIWRYFLVRKQAREIKLNIHPFDL